MCAAIIGEASDKKTLLVGRTNKVYGIEIKVFRSRLIAIVAKLLNTELGSLEDSILAMTAHRSKGQEAHTVIILDATQKQFPKVHPTTYCLGFSTLLHTRCWRRSVVCFTWLLRGLNSVCSF